MVMERAPTGTGILCAPNGGRRMPSDHPALPITPQALAETVEACLAAGAGAFHIHVRRPDGGHSLDVGLYREALAAIRDIVGRAPHLQISTEQLGRYGPEDQMALVRALQPDGASLALREILPPERSDPGWRAQIADFLTWMDQAGIARQLIIYLPEELERLSRLRDEGIVPSAPASLLLVLGSYGVGEEGRPEHLLRFLQKIDPKDIWWIAAFGPHEGRCALTAALLGGHTRLGFENNMTLLSGEHASDNAAIVREFAETLAAAGIGVLGVEAVARMLCHPNIV